MKPPSKRAQETQANLCEAFVQLYAEKSLSDISIRDITTRAGYNRGTFYLYYQDIYDMLEQVRNDVIERFFALCSAHMQSNASITLADLVQLLIAFIEDNKRIVLPLFTRDPQCITALKARIFSGEMPLIQLPENVDRSQLDYILDYHFSSVLQLIMRWYDKGEDLPLAELIGLIQQLSTRGVFSVLADMGCLTLALHPDAL